MDYEGGPFWAYVMDTYGDDFAVGGRKTWDGPSFDACQFQVVTDPHGIPYRPHNFKFFEAWNAVVRDQVHAVDPDIRLDQYPGEYCDMPEGFWDESFLHVGQINPLCLQTVEFEMDVIEDLIKAQVFEQGTPLAKSLMLDFAVAHAKAFPPNSLLFHMPEQVACTEFGRLNHAKGFGTGNPECGFDDPIADANICPAARVINEDDFYARLQFRILEPQAHYLWLRANDDATLYVNGKIVLGEAVEDNGSSEDFPNASTTYADQSEQWAKNNAPASSIFPVGNPLGKTFEIEWVNRGNTRGNNEWDDEHGCAADNSRYLLQLQWSDQPISSTFQILGDDKVQLIDARFWPRQGSGSPGFHRPAAGGAIPRFDDYTSPASHEIQLRPVGWLKRTFLLPALAVNYHPVQCPIFYEGDLEVLVVNDALEGIHSWPEVQLLSLEAQDQVEWLGDLDEVDPLIQRVVLTCDGHSEAAKIGEAPAIVLVTNKRSLTHPVENPYGQMGAVHYTVFVKMIEPFREFLPLVRR